MAPWRQARDRYAPPPVSYRVELPVFSGPMDLLLHLVRQQEVDIHEISIARILGDYLKHLGVLRQLDLQDMGDFVVMASTLMEIKSRELLPSEAVEIEQELDPRDDLIRRLLEYKRYRDLARQLETSADRRARQAPLVLATPAHLQEEGDDDLLDLGDLGIWDLTSAFAKLLDEIGQQGTLNVEVEKRDVGYYTRRLLETFKQRREVQFAEIFDRSEGRFGLIGTLIALLEMMKQGYLRAFQEKCFGEIHLAYRGDDDVTADRILAGITADEERQRAQEAAAAAAQDGDGQNGELAEAAADPAPQARADREDADDLDGDDDEDDDDADFADPGDDDVDEEPSAPLREREFGAEG
jgi:segregation and condensation protein A